MKDYLLNICTKIASRYLAVGDTVILPVHSLDGLNYEKGKQVIIKQICDNDYYLGGKYKRYIATGGEGGGESSGPLNHLKRA